MFLLPKSWSSDEARANSTYLKNNHPSFVSAEFESKVKAYDAGDHLKEPTHEEKAASNALELRLAALESKQSKVDTLLGMEGH